jgi:maltokinase
MPGASAALAHTLAPDLVGPTASERPITVDQSNYSVVVDDAIIVKWLLQPTPAPAPSTWLLAHLRAVGFAEMPPYIGELVEDGLVKAIATGFVPGALDGWDWCVDELAKALGKGDAPTGAVASAQRIAALVARLHRSLATPTDIIPDPVGRDTLHSEAQRGTTLLTEALAVVEGPPATLLHRHAAAIEEAITALHQDVEIAVQPLHGDLHVGQILRAGNQLLLNDFDGDPLSGATGVTRRSPLVDLAALIQSFDHVGRIVVRRRLPGAGRAVNEYIDAAVSVVMAEYAHQLDVDLGPVLPQLRALRLIQELHEMVYAQRMLPRWMYVPEAALAALMAG